MEIFLIFSVLFMVTSGQEDDGINVHTRIIGGRRARPHEFPNQVAIKMITGETCGGTIIDNHWILTAAHCVTHIFKNTKTMVRRVKVIDPKILTVYLGAIDVYGTNTIQVGVEQIYVHPKYNPTVNKENDIALLRTIRECIRQRKHDDPDAVFSDKAVVPFSSKTTVGQKVWTVGYGMVDPLVPVANDYLKTVDVKILPDEVCSKQFKTPLEKYNPKLMICAGYLQGGKDSCNGDSGGPLLFKGNQENDGNDAGATHVILGIVSHGVNGTKCAEKNMGAAYTRVGAYVKWMKDIIDKYDADQGNSVDAN